jgi:hypothetical protein
MVVVHRSLRPALVKQPMRFREYMKGRHVQQKLDRRKFRRAIAMDRNRRNLDAALRTAEAGLPVFPINPAQIGRRWTFSRVYPSGPRTASRSREKILSWWDEHIEAPGIPCTNIVVLHADQEGVAALEALIAKYGDWPFPPIVLTPTGKDYYFLQPDPPLESHSGCLPEGIDVRGVGTFIIAPGTVLSDGSSWRVDESAPPASTPELPTWLERMSRSPAF